MRNEQEQLVDSKPLNTEVHLKKPERELLGNHENREAQAHSGYAKIANILQKHRFKQPFMLWAIYLAATSQFKGVHPTLMRMLLSLFRSWVQTRICEKANKVIRDACTRVNASKVQ